MASILDRRQYPRKETDVYAVLRNEPVVNPVRILDVSKGGMRLRDVGGVRKGSQISIQLIGGEMFQGHVTWVRDHEVGFQFTYALDEDHRILTEPVRY
jgi:hypothetical protein